MASSHINNPRTDLIIEELLEGVERQKSDIEILREQMASDNTNNQKTILELQKKATAKIQELEKEIEDLKLKLSGLSESHSKESQDLKKEIARLKKTERVLLFIKKRCLRAYTTSTGFFKLRNFAALEFLWFTAKLLVRYNENNIFFIQDELAIMFPKKYKKKPVMEIKIPAAEEKKERLRDWKRIWLWKKAKE